LLTEKGSLPKFFRVRWRSGPGINPKITKLTFNFSL
jgi:hypothetical protein